MPKSEPHNGPRNYFCGKVWVGEPALSMADKPIVERIHYLFFPRALSPGHCSFPNTIHNISKRPAMFFGLKWQSIDRVGTWPKEGSIGSQEWPLSSWYNHDLKKSTPVTATFPDKWSTLIHHKREANTFRGTVVLLAIVHQAQLLIALPVIV